MDDGAVLTEAATNTIVRQIYLLSTVQPASFWKDQIKVIPETIGAPLKRGWMDNIIDDEAVVGILTGRGYERQDQAGRVVSGLGGICSHG